MNISEVVGAQDLGAPKRRHHDLLRARHLAVTNRLFWQSLQPYETALHKFAKELEAEFVKEGSAPRSVFVSSSYITISWADRTEISVRASNSPVSHGNPPLMPPHMTMRKVNDHIRRVCLSKRETPASICQRVLGHFRNTESVLAVAKAANHRLPLAA